MPRPVCVRSLVPKLKNSADWAISSAVSAPLGTSIIVPTMYASFTFRSACTARAEDPGEIVALVRQQFRERRLPRLERVGEDHLAHRVDAVPLEEHVLGAAESDADRTERDRIPRLLRRVRVGAHDHPRGLIAP